MQPQLHPALTVCVRSSWQIDDLTYLQVGRHHSRVGGGEAATVVPWASAKAKRVSPDLMVYVQIPE